MTRIPLGSASFVDALPSGAYCALIIGSHVQTHRGRVPLPPGETFGPMFLHCTNIEFDDNGHPMSGFRFAGLAHDALNRIWEWSARRGWRGIDGPTSGRLVYDAGGHLRDELPAGYQFFSETTGQPISRNVTYAPKHGLSEWADVGDLLIGQGHDSIAPAGTGGVLVWDGTQHRQLEGGQCTFINRHIDGERVAISFCTPGTALIVQATFADLRALPIYHPPPQPPHEEDDMHAPRVDVREYDPVISPGKPWHATVTDPENGTTFTVEKRANDSIHFRIANAKGEDVSGRFRPLQVKP